jgi:hypothetical protein|tara:strand:+ start:3703 stop:3894 length:192 start_codon:yes stop_codon:yes gene_type:complete
MDGIILFLIVLSVFVFGTIGTATVYHLVDWEAIKKNKNTKARSILLKKSADKARRRKKFLTSR